MPKYLDLTGLSYLWGKITSKFVAKETGKGLSTNDFTTAEKTKLAGIETGAEVNVIDSISVNGTAITPVNKEVDITVTAGLSNDIKDAILDCFENVAWIGSDGATYYNALLNLFYPVDSISAVFNQGTAVIYATDSLEDLRQYLTVTANYEDGTTGTVTNYTLSGTLTEGTSTITVTYSGKTTTFNVTVTVSPSIYPMSLTDQSDGVGFGSFDSSKNTMTPPYVANSNNTRIHAMGTDALGYPVEYGNTYTISIASGSTAYALAVTTFNEDGVDQIENTQAVSTANAYDTGWMTLTNGSCTFTPSMISNKVPVRMWIVFKKDSAGTGRWANVSDITPITITES